MGRAPTAAAGRADRFGRRIAAAETGQAEFIESVAYFRAVMAAVSRVGPEQAKWADEQCRALGQQLTNFAIQADQRTTQK